MGNLLIPEEGGIEIEERFRSAGQLDQDKLFEFLLEHEWDSTKKILENLPDDKRAKLLEMLEEDQEMRAVYDLTAT